MTAWRLIRATCGTRGSAKCLLAWRKPPSACPKRWRIARAARRGYILNTSGRCWQRCSISSAFTPASSGNGGRHATPRRHRACTNPADLGAVKPDPRPGSAGADHHRLRHGAQREGAGEGWVIGFTPTYSGCPATEHLLGAIRETLTENGFSPVHIVLQLEPARTTDWMNDDARRRLREYGISPPVGHSCHAHVPAEVSCPRCASTDTSLISEFGSTACKALYRCNTCREPFDYFKCI